MGARTMAHMMCTENVQPAHLSSLHIVLPIFSLPFSNFTSLSSTCLKGASTYYECEKQQYPEVICVTCFIIYSFTMIMIKLKGSHWWGSILYVGALLSSYYAVFFFSCLNPK